MATLQVHTALWILLLATCRPAAVLFGQDLPVERLDGLSHNTVTAILQDRHGFLWIGTPDGLNRYDGYDVVVYRHDRADPTSLSNNSVKVLLEDQNGNLWIGSDGGLDRFDRTTDRFVRYALDPTSPRKAVLQLLEDHAGILWIGGDRLYRYHPETDQFSVYRHEPGHPNSLAGHYIASLFESRDGTLWVGTDGKVLHRYDPEADHFVRLPLPESWDSAVILYEDETNRLWLFDPYSPTTTFAYTNETFTPLTGIPPNHFIRAVLDDRRGFRWIGADDGLYRVDPATNDVQHVRMDPAPGAYLQNNVTTLYEDRAGTLWIGAFSGLYRIDPRAKPFRHLGHNPTDANSLSSNTVMAIREDEDGILWIGTLGGGLNRFDRHTGAVTRFRHYPDHAHSLCSDLIWALDVDRDGTLWIGTNAGLCALDPRTGRFAPYPLPPDDSPAPPPVNAIRADAAGRLWIATTIGLYRVDPATKDVRWYAQPGDDPHDRSRNFFLQSLHLDRDGALWIGAFGGVLYRFDPDTEHFTRYPLSLSDDEDLISEGIWAIHEADDATFWLGSDLGLTHFDPRDGAVEHFTQHDGLPGSIVYAILQDDLLGRLWLSTNRGLARFDEHLPEDRAIRRYDTGDGLHNTEFNRRAAFQSRDGTFYFGGLDGLTWFAPTSIQDNVVVPPVVITRIETSNRDTTASVNPYGLDHLVLSYRDYTLAFEFAALNFTNPTKNRYRYRLVGFDDGWSEAGTRRYVRYTNIPPGSYVFRVIGSNNDGRWNESGATLPVRVLPPFWQTWWFRLLALAAVAGLLTAAYRYRVARLLEVERIRLRIASDLHDDIGSRLSGIALMSDMMRDAPLEATEHKAQLTKISHAARQLVDGLRDIVWFITPDHDKTGEMIVKMEKAASTLLGETTYTFTCVDPALLDGADIAFRRNVYLIFKEALHNVARHARARTVEIHLHEQHGTFTLRIADDGVGFDPQNGEINRGHGLRTMTYRAQEIGGHLDLQSIPSGGTRLVLSAKITHLRNGIRTRRSRF